MAPLFTRESFRQRFWTAASLIVVVPVGFATKWYAGPAARWVQNSLGGVFYEIFWCLVFVFLLPRARPQVVAVWVFAITSLLECLQLSKHPVLAWIREAPLGRTLIGTTFVWSDFIYYVVGCAIGWWWLSGLQRGRVVRGSAASMTALAIRTASRPSRPVAAGDDPVLMASAHARNSRARESTRPHCQPRSRSAS